MNTVLWMCGALALAASHDEATPADVAAATDEATEPNAAPPGPIVDRTSPPPVQPPEVLVLPEPVVHQLTPAVTVYHVRVPGVRKVEIALLPRRGQASVTGTTGVEGAAVGWLADAASQTHTAAEFSELEDLHSVDVYSGLYTFDGKVGVEGPLPELDTALDMLTEIVRGAAFPKTETKRWVLDQYQYFGVSGPSSQGRVAARADGFGWFPADSPYGARPDPGTLASIEPAALEAHYRRWLSESPIDVLAVGDFAFEDVEMRLLAMVEGLGQPGDLEPQPTLAAKDGNRVIAVDMPGQEQVALRLRTEAPPQQHEQRVAMRAINYVLGGHFLSRLNTNLREEKGWTYGSRSSYQVRDAYGYLSINVDVGAENTAAAVREIEGELQRLVDEGVTADELQLAYRRMVAGWNNTNITAAEAFESYEMAIDDRESMETLRARYVDLADLTPEQLKAVAAEWLHPDKPRQWVLVGDRAQIEAHLEELGWTAEWLTPQQAILGRF